MCPLVVARAPSSVHEVDAIYRRPSLVGDLQGPCNLYPHVTPSLHVSFPFSLLPTLSFRLPFLFSSLIVFSPLSAPYLPPCLLPTLFFLYHSIFSPPPPHHPFPLPFLILSFLSPSVSSSSRPPSLILHSLSAVIAVILEHFFAHIFRDHKPKQPPIACSYSISVLLVDICILA